MNRWTWFGRERNTFGRYFARFRYHATKEIPICFLINYCPYMGPPSILKTFGSFCLPPPYPWRIRELLFSRAHHPCNINLPHHCPLLLLTYLTKSLRFILPSVPDLCTYIALQRLFDPAPLLRPPRWNPSLGCFDERFLRWRG